MVANIKKRMKEQLAQIQAENAKVQIGKNGITENVLEEIKTHLKQNQLVKIKFLQNFLTEDLDADIDKICKETKTTLIDKRGKTAILYKGRM
ncbi:MAG: YhbY family RNA-binding protein [Candidatus Thorarchaeota archaeon]